VNCAWWRSNRHSQKARRSGALLARLAKDKGVQSMVGEAIAESSDSSFLAKIACNTKGLWLSRCIDRKCDMMNATITLSARASRIEGVRSGHQQDCAKEGGQDGARLRK